MEVWHILKGYPVIHCNHWHHSVSPPAGPRLHLLSELTKGAPIPHVGTFTHIRYPTWDDLTADTTLPCSFKVYWSRLHKIVGVMYLLGKIKEVVHDVRTTTRWKCWHRRRDRKDSISDENVFHMVMTVLYCSPIVGSHTLPVAGASLFLWASVEGWVSKIVHLYIHSLH